MEQEIIYDGVIKRENGKVIVEATGEPYCVDFGAICLNPDAPEKERIYQKTFVKKPVFLFDEYPQVTSTLRSNAASFVLSMNGYSTLKADWLEKYGIKKGAYEQSCIAILKNIIDRLRNEFPGARLHLIYGASDMGVDWAIEQVAYDSRYNLDLLGFSCPRYMLYVKDDHIPVFVAPNKDIYADYYIKSLDFLISTGGRDQALKHDVMAACIYQRRIHFVDALNLLTDNNVPAVVTEHGVTRIENASAAFGRNISFSSARNTIVNTPKNGDKWKTLFDDIAANAIEVCRDIMPADKMFK